MSTPSRSWESFGRRLAADPTHPRVGDRRRPGHARARTARAGSPTPTTPRRGRALTFIEDFIRDEVLPRYANTHTESSGTGLQTTRLREDARRDHPRRGRRRRRDGRHLLPAPGSTGAIDKLVGILGLRIPADLDDRYTLGRRDSRRPSVRSSSSARSSTTPTSCRGASRSPTWSSSRRTSTATSTCDASSSELRRATPTGRSRSAPSRRPATSPASSPTPRAISALLHEHGALSFWDFAAAAPYVDIEMYPATCGARADGVQGRDLPLPAQVHRRAEHAGRARRPPRAAHATACPTCRAAARSRTSTRSSTSTSPTRSSARRAAPRRSSSRSGPGSSSSSRTPSASSVIRAREDALPAPRRRRRGSDEPAIEILGNLDAERLSIVSFVVRAPSGRYLHHNFVVAAAQRPVRHPVARRLLVRRAVRPPAARHRHRALARVRARDRARLRGHQARLGAGQLQLLHLATPSSTTSSRRCDWSRATAGGCCRDYAFDPATGLWRHRGGPAEPPLRLRQLAYDEDGAMTLPVPHDRRRRGRARRYLDEARALLAAAAAPQTSATRRWATCRPTSTTCGGSTCRSRASGPRQGPSHAWASPLRT